MRRAFAAGMKNKVNYNQLLTTMVLSVDEYVLLCKTAFALLAPRGAAPRSAGSADQSGGPQLSVLLERLSQAELLRAPSRALLCLSRSHRYPRASDISRAMRWSARRRRCTSRIGCNATAFIVFAGSIHEGCQLQDVHVAGRQSVADRLHTRSSQRRAQARTRVARRGRNRCRRGTSRQRRSRA